MSLCHSIDRDREKAIVSIQFIDGGCRSFIFLTRKFWINLLPLFFPKHKCTHIDKNQRKMLEGKTIFVWFWICMLLYIVRMCFSLSLCLSFFLFILSIILYFFLCVWKCPQTLKNECVGGHRRRTICGCLCATDCIQNNWASDFLINSASRVSFQSVQVYRSKWAIQQFWAHLNLKSSKYTLSYLIRKKENFFLQKPNQNRTLFKSYSCFFFFFIQIFKMETIQFSHYKI